MNHPFQFYLITHQSNLSDEDFFKIISIATSNGISSIQFRDKTISDEQFIQKALKFIQIKKNE